ncbi:hypothetical protein N9B77_00080 [Flavobacteriaceae bacterium]|nr:hypothetical protein [Flavobacteriaceae bacterium]
MGLFGPTKKSGGLDKRYKSNKGGYMGKAFRFGSAVSDLASSSSTNDSYESYEQEERDAAASSKLAEIVSSTVPSTKEELKKYLSELMPLLSDDGVQKIALGVSQDLKDNIKQAAQEKYMMAGYILQELSPTDAVFFEKKLAKVKSDENKRKKILIFLLIMFVIMYVVLFSTGVLSFN